MSASKLLEQIGFDNDEKKRVVKMVEDIYTSLLFRKLKYLLPLEKGERAGKRIDFLKKDIDNNRLFMIYCYNQFSKTSDQFSVPIDDAILKKDAVYKKILNSDPPLSVEDQIDALQGKINRQYFVTRDIYVTMMSKIEKTCEKILDNVGDNIANDPAKLAIVMHFIIDTVHIAEMDSIELMKKDPVSEDTGPEDVCNANKHFGVDWSFLGIFDKLPKECVEKVDSTKISIVGPVTLVQSDKIVGGKSRKRGSKGRKRQTKWHHNI